MDQLGDDVASVIADLEACVLEAVEDILVYVDLALIGHGLPILLDDVLEQGRAGRPSQLVGLCVDILRRGWRDANESEETRDVGAAFRLCQSLVCQHWSHDGGLVV